jgi:hypothetical protein
MTATHEIDVVLRVQRGRRLVAATSIRLPFTGAFAGVLGQETSPWLRLDLTDRQTLEQAQAQIAARPQAQPPVGRLAVDLGALTATPVCSFPLARRLSEQRRHLQGETLAQVDARAVGSVVALISGNLVCQRVVHHSPSPKHRLHIHLPPSFWVWGLPQ